MSITIETLLFELDIDTSNIDKKLDASIARIENRLKRIQTATSAFDPQEVSDYNRELDRSISKLDKIVKLKSQAREEAARNSRSNQSVNKGKGATLDLGSTNNILQNLRGDVQAQTRVILEGFKKNTDAIQKQDVKSTSQLAREFISSSVIKGTSQVAASPFKGLNLRKELEQQFSGAMTSKLNALSQQLALSLRVEEGASRLSEALDQSFSKGVAAIVGAFKGEILTELGFETAPQTATVRGKDSTATGKAAKEFVSADKSLGLVKSEMSATIVKIRQISVSLKALTESFDFQKVNAERGEVSKIIEKLDKSISSQDPSELNAVEKDNYDQKVALLKKATLQLEVLSRSASMVQFEDLQAAQEDAISQFDRLEKEAGVLSATLKSQASSLRGLKTKLLQTKRADLTSEMSKLNTTLKEGSPLLRQIEKITKLEAQSQFILNKQVAALAKAKRETKRAAGTDTIAKLAEVNLGLKTDPRNAELLAKRQEIEKAYKQEQVKVIKAQKALSQTRRDLEILANQKINLGQAAQESGVYSAQDRKSELESQLKLVQAEINRRMSAVPVLFNELNSVLNIKVPQIDDMPTLAVGTREANDATFLPTNNQIIADAAIVGEAAKGIKDASLKSIELMAHEMAHAIQTSSGKNYQAIKAGQMKPKLLNNLARMTKEESLVIGKALEQYRAAGVNASVMLLEIDAHLTGMRAKQKALSVKKVANTGKVITGLIKDTIKTNGEMTSLAQKLLGEGNETGAKEVLRAKYVLKAEATNELTKQTALQNTEGQLNPEKYLAGFRQSMKNLAELKKRMAAYLESQLAGDKSVKMPTLKEVEADADKQAKVKSKTQKASEGIQRLSTVVSDLGSIASQVAKEFEGLVDSLKAVKAPENKPSQDDAWNEDEIPLSEVSVMPAQNKTSDIAKKATAAFGLSLLNATKTVYQASRAIEGFALAFIPAGQQIKGTMQAIAPVALGGAAIAAVPGAGGLALGALQGLEAGLLPAFQLGGSILGGGIEAAVTGSLTSASSVIAGALSSALPGFAQGAVSQIAGLLPTAAAGIGSAAGGVAAEATVIALEVGTVVVPAIAASKAIVDKVNNSIESFVGTDSDNKLLQASQKLAGVTQEQLQIAQSALRSYRDQKKHLMANTLSAAQLSKLPSSEMREVGNAQLKQLKAALNEGNTALVATQVDSSASQQIASIKGNIRKRYDSILKAMHKKSIPVDVEVLSPDSMSQARSKQKEIKQRGNPLNFKVDPSIARKQGKDFGDASIDGLKDGLDSASPSKRTLQEGVNFSDGFQIGIDRELDLVEASGYEVGERGLQGLRRAIDSHSPSEETKKEGKNFVDGSVNEIKAGQKSAHKAGKDFGDASLKGLKESASKGRGKKGSSQANIDDLKEAANINDLNQGLHVKGGSVGNKRSEQQRAAAIHDQEVAGIKAGQSFMQGLVNSIKQKAGDAKFAAKLISHKLVDGISDKIDFGITGEHQATNATVKEKVVSTAKAAKSYFVGDNQAKAQEEINTLLERANLHMAEADVAIGGVDGKYKALRTSAVVAAESMGEGTRATLEGLKSLIGGSSVLGSQLAPIFEGFKKGFMGVGREARQARMDLLALSSIAVLALFGRQIGQAIASLYTLSKAVENTEQKLKATGIVLSGNLFSQFGEQADKAGLGVVSFADQYAQMVAALRGKVANPADVFGGLSQGLAGMGVSGQGQERALGALSQMASKGVVSMEELRQQLGEALPNAMGLSARAMGLTESQLMKLVSSGQLAASDFLPKFAKEISKAGGEINTLAANQARLANQWDKIKFDASRIIPFNLALKGLAEALKVVGYVAVPLAALVGGVLVSSFIVAAKYAVGLAVKLGLTRAAMLAFTKVALLSAGVMVAAAAGFQIWADITDKANAPIRKLTKDMEGLSDAQERSNKLANEGASNYKSGNFLANLTNRGRLREENRTVEALSESQSAIIKEIFELQVKITPESIDQAQKDLQPVKDRIKELTDQLASKDALGLSKVEANAKRQELSGLENQLESEVETRFGASNLGKVQAGIDRQRQYIQQAIDSGANKSRFTVMISELDIREEALNKLNAQVKSFSASMSLNIEAGITARSDKQAIAGTLAASNSTRDLSFYQTQGGKSSASQEIAERAKLSQSIAQQISLYSQSKSSQEDYINSFGATAQELVKSMSGATSLAAVTPQQLAKLQEEAKLNDGLTEETKQLIEAVGQLVGTGQDLQDANVEQAKAAYEAANRLRDLRIAAPKLGLAGDRLNLDQKRFGVEQDKKKDSVKIQSVDIEQQNVDFKNQLIDLQNSFLDFNLGIKDSIRQINSSSRDLSLELVKAGQAAYQASINGFSSFTQAAGLEDILGIGKLEDLIGKAASVRASDRRPELQNAKADAQVDFDLKQEDRERRKAELIRQNANNIGNLRREEQRASISQAQLMKEESFTLEELSLRYREMQFAVSDHNREVSATNQQLAELGESTRIGQIDFSAVMPEDPQAIWDAMQAGHEQMTKNRNQAIAAQQAATNQQIADVNRLSKVEQDAFKKQQALKDKQIESEGARVQQENEKVKLEAQGVMLAFSTNLKTQLQSLTDKSTQAESGVDGIFSEAKMPVYNIGQKKANVAEATINKQLSELSLQKSAIDESIKAATGGLGKNQVLGILQEGVSSGNIDEELGNQLLHDFAKATNAEEFRAVVARAKEASAEIQFQYDRLAQNTNEVLERIKELASRELNRKIEDTQFEQRVNEPKGYQTDLDEKKNAVVIESERLSLDYARQLEDMEGSYSPDEIHKYGEELKKLNLVKLDKLKAEATALFQIKETATKSLESGVQSFFTGFGDSLFNGGEKIKAERQALIDYGNTLGELKEKYSNDPDLFLKAKEGLDILNEQKLDKLKDEFSVLGSIMDSAKSALVGFAKAMLDAVAQMAAQALTKSVINGLAGAFGGGGGWGSLVGAVLGRAAWGGTVGDGVGSTSMTQGGQIGRAMAAEGKGAIPIVAHKGEEILSTRNNDAQFQQALKRSGDWDRMKSVSGFAKGGTVGGSSNSYASALRKTKESRPTVNNYSNQVSYNLHGDSNSLRQSVSQIESERQRRQSEVYRRNS